MKRCEKGVDFLSVRLAVVIIVAAMVIAAASSYLGQVTAREQASRARDGVIRVVELSRMEYALSVPDEGTGTDIGLEIPPCVRRVVFGCSPGEAGLGHGFDRYGGAYFIDYADGTSEIFVSDIGFAYGDAVTGKAMDDPVCVYPGVASLIIRIMTVNGTPMAVIFGGALCGTSGE